MTTSKQPVPSRVRQIVGETTTTTTQSKSGKIVSEIAESTPIHPMDEFTNNEPHAMVGVEGSLTKNLGNFESLRVQVSITLPSRSDNESVRATFNNAAAMVDEFINIEIQKATGQMSR